MKSLCGFLGLALIVVAPASAQYGMRTGALGGGSGSRAMSRPLGGSAPAYGNRGFRNAAPRTPYYGYPYGYSFYAPGYFDYLDDQSQYVSPYISPYGLPPAAPAYYGPAQSSALGPQQPVIINQYFGSAPGPQQTYAPDPAGVSAQVPGGLIGSPANYYLIAYKNHAVYTAISYWVEDKTLHYVTTQNTHNQASLDLIDLTLTKSLNQHNDVPFSIAGQ